MSQTELSSKIDVTVRVNTSNTKLCGDDCRFKQEACVLFMSKLKVVSFKNGMFERCPECTASFPE